MNKEKILKPTKEVIEKAATIIRNGGLVAFPTETVYGLGTNAFDAIAVAKIFEVKQRPHFDPIIVHIADLEMLRRLCMKIDEKAKKLTQKFWPGPLTLILPKTNIVPDIVTAGLKVVAIRMPSHKIALELIRKANTPIAAPSANPFGYLSPTQSSHVAEQIGNKIDLIIDGGECPVGIESTILDLTSTPTILRFGGLPVEEIEKLIGKVKISKINKTPRSPGQLPYHYSPRTPLKLIKGRDFNIPKGIKAGFLAFNSTENKSLFEKVEILSPKGDLREAASNLFSCLHRLDKANLDIIYAEYVPDIGLGRAINERLKKAEKGSRLL